MKHLQSLTHKQRVENILIKAPHFNNARGCCGISSYGCIKLNRSTTFQQKNFVFCEMSRQLVNIMLGQHFRNSSETFRFILKKLFIKTTACDFPNDGIWEACIVHVLKLSERFLKVSIHCQYLKDKNIVFGDEFECFIAPLIWVSSEEKQQFKLIMNNFPKITEAAV